MHGTIMVFFVLTTAPFAAFGNYFLPIQVARRICVPRFNMMMFWVTFIGSRSVSSFFIRDGPTRVGLTQYAPLNAIVPRESGRVHGFSPDRSAADRTRGGAHDDQHGDVGDLQISVRE